MSETKIRGKMRKLDRRFSQKIFFFSFMVLGLIVFFTLPRLTIPLSIAYILFLVFGPMVPALAKFGISRRIAVLIVFASIIFFFIYPIIKVAPNISREAKNLQYYIPKVERFVQSGYRDLRVVIKEKIGYELDDNYISKGISYVKQGSTNFLLNVPQLLASVVEWVFLVPLFLFFLLQDASGFRLLVLKIVPNSIFERFYYLSHQFNKQLGDYIFAKFVEATIVGVIITSGLLIMGIRFSLLLGALAAVTNIIPYLGPVLGIVPALILGLAEYGVGATFGAMMLLYLIANAIDIGIVFPILVSKIVNLHPIIVVVSVILGSQTMGIVGMVVSIPLAAALKLILVEIYNDLYSARER